MTTTFHITPEFTQTESIPAMRRELWRHGITTVDLDNAALYEVVQTATALMEAGGHSFDDWRAWERAILMARRTVEGRTE